MKFILENCQKALIIGCGHGIGLGLIQTLLKQNTKIQVMGTYRSGHTATEAKKLINEYGNRLQLIQLDPTCEEDLEKMADQLKEQGWKVDLLINSVGLLHNEKINPEKSLRSFNADDYLEVVRVNSVVTPLLAKHFEKLFNKTSAFISISAKVGSIEDNQMGGWYSYRASKAALNMLIKTISIEFQRKRKNCLVLAIHPGTTITELSRPFIKNTQYQLHSPIETAENILSIIDQKEISETGSFFSWSGERILW